MLQSRITVTGETLSTSAVSSTLSPPKKRISTTCTLRGSSRASAFIASSSATRSVSRAAAHHGCLIQGNMLHAAAAFQVVSPRMLHQNAPH